MWEIEGTDQFDSWYHSLDEAQQEAVSARVDMLDQDGPTLGRPVIGDIKTSRHNMKELRCSKAGTLRILFVFDPLRQAVLLLGGDKSEDSAWNAWYQTAIPEADDLYDTYLQELRDEGLLP